MNVTMINGVAIVIVKDGNTEQETKEKEILRKMSPGCFPIGSTGNVWEVHRPEQFESVPIFGMALDKARQLKLDI